MTAINIGPAKHRPLRVQLTVLYAGLIAVLAVAVLAVSGLLERQGSTSIDGGSSSRNAVFGQHFDIGTLIVAVAAAIVAVGLGWWTARRYLRRLSTPSDPTATE